MMETIKGNTNQPRTLRGTHTAKAFGIRAWAQANHAERQTLNKQTNKQTQPQWQKRNHSKSKPSGRW